MNPMTFEEFLIALDCEMWAQEIRECYKSLKPCLIHDKLLELYRTYLCIGGMPNSINAYKEVNQEVLLYDKTIISNIIISYLADMNKYTLTPTESIKIEKVFNAIPVALSKENRKFMYVDIEPKAEKRLFETAIDWLVSSNMINKCLSVNNIQKPLKAFSQQNIFKLYYNDVGLLTSSLNLDYSDILLDKQFLVKGALAETYVAQELNSKKMDLYYFNPSSMEIDFLISNADGIIPIEVKAGTHKVSKSLNAFMEKFKPNYAIRISAKNFGSENNIKSVPLYATFCIE
jgi:predicted AAA+ superfamily ATPase